MNRSVLLGLSTVTLTIMLASGCSSSDSSGGDDFHPEKDGGDSTEEGGDSESICGNTSISVWHCGQCHHRCEQGICRDGQCVSATVIAEGQAGPAFVIVQGRSLYWVNTREGNRIIGMEIEGGVPRAIAKNDHPVTALASNETALFWSVAGTGFAADGSIVRWNLDGLSDPVTLADGLPYPTDLVVAEGYVYWTNYDGPNVMKVPWEGGESIELASGFASAVSIAIGKNAVYWASGTFSNASIMSVPLEGGTPQVFASELQLPRGLRLDSRNLYWSNTNAFGLVHKQPLAGGPRVVLSSFSNGNGEIAIDNTFVYWSQTSDSFPRGTTISKVPIEGGDAIAIAAHTSEAYPLIGMALDDTRIYWTDLDKGLVLATDK